MCAGLLCGRAQAEGGVGEQTVQTYAGAGEGRPKVGQEQEQINVLQLQIIEWAALELVAFEFVIKACKLHGKLRFDYWVKTQLRLDDCHYSKQVTHLK